MSDPKGPSTRPLDWRQVHLWQIQPVRDVLMLLAVFGLLWLGYKLSVVTVPILLALLLAYLFEPLVRALTRRQYLSRPGVALGLIVAAFFVIVVPVTVGIGTAAVQGVRIAKAVGETSSNFLSVMSFHRRAQAEGEAFGKVEVVEAEGQEPALRFIPNKANEEARKAAERAKLAFTQLPPNSRWLPLKLIETDLESLPPPEDEPDHQDQPTPEDAESPDPSLSPDPSIAPAEPSERVSPPPPVEPRQPNDTGTFHALLETGLFWIQDNATAIAATLGRRAIGTGAEAISFATRTLQSIVSFGLMLFLAAFFFYFFCTGYGKVLSFWESLIPERRKGRIIELLQKMDAVIAGFVRGRLLIALCLVALYTLGYWFIGVPAPLLIGPIVGALAIIPFISAIALPLAMILMVIEPSSWEWQQAWWWIILGPLLVNGLERLLDDYILTPLIQGKQTDMDTPSILFASLAGGVLAGVYGLLLAIPVAACIKILLKEIFWPRFKAWAEGRERDFLPLDPKDAINSEHPPP